MAGFANVANKDVANDDFPEKLIQVGRKTMPLQLL